MRFVRFGFKGYLALMALCVLLVIMTLLDARCSPKVGGGFLGQVLLWGC